MGHDSHGVPSNPYEKGIALDKLLFSTLLHAIFPTQPLDKVGCRHRKLVVFNTELLLLELLPLPVVDLQVRLGATNRFARVPALLFYSILIPLGGHGSLRKLRLLLKQLLNCPSLQHASIPRRCL